MKFPRLPAEQVVEILDMINAGGNHMAVAASHEITLPHLYHIMKQQGVKIGRGHQSSVLDRFSESDIDQMIALYEADERVLVICAQFDMTERVFYSVLATLGVPTRAERKEEVLGEDLRIEKAVRMYSEGWAYWKIEVETGIHHLRLLKVLHKRGYKMRINRELRPRELKK